MALYDVIVFFLGLIVLKLELKNMGLWLFILSGMIFVIHFIGSIIYPQDIVLHVIAQVIVIFFSALGYMIYKQMLLFPNIINVSIILGLTALFNIYSISLLVWIFCIIIISLILKKEAT